MLQGLLKEGLLTILSAVRAEMRAEMSEFRSSSLLNSNSLASGSNPSVSGVSTPTANNKQDPVEQRRCSGVRATSEKQVFCGRLQSLLVHAFPFRLQRFGRACFRWKDVRHLSYLLEEFGVKVHTEIVRCDNSPAILFVRNRKYSRDARNICRKTFMVRVWVEQGTLEVVQVISDEMVADGLTKELRGYVLGRSAQRMGLTGVEADGHWRKHSSRW